MENNNMEHEEKFLVTLSKGKEDVFSSMLAFSFANSALSLKLDTTVYLMNEGVKWVTEDAFEEKGFEMLNDLITSFLKGGGHILVSIPCTEYFVSQGDESLKALREGVQTTSFVPIINLIKRSESINF